MEEVKFSKKPKLKNPYLIAAWPGIGEVAFKAAMYLINKLKAEELAEIPAQDFFYLTGSLVRGGILDAPELPFSKFYSWKNKSGANDLIIFVSNAQPDLAKAEDYCKRIISVARSFKVKAIVSFAARPQAVDYTQAPKVWLATTGKEMTRVLSKYNFPLLLEGQISGMNGLFLGIAKKEGFQGFYLLGEVPLYTIQI
jgi:predicted ATP-grasp superfamily ATP-dependent carboligase